MNMPVERPAGAEARTPFAREIARRRTFAIISHPDAGKTTLTEKLLLFGGAIQLAGQVKAKRNRQSARSDWMTIERERGISVVTSVMTFEYDGRIFNLLDTPGHEDFSEDTYRTLTAVDSAVMVIDAAKGIEPRTRKLFEVCRLRDIPILTFINKMDRESRDPFELLDEIEHTLALDVAPVNWPVGRGRDFVGTIDVASGGVRLIEGDAGKAGTLRTMSIAEVAARNPALSADAIEEEFALVREACKKFDLQSFREGHLSPVFFGSALNNFGVGDLLDAIGSMAPPPREQKADKRVVAADEDRMSGHHLQDPGEHRSQSPRPHRLCAAVFGQAHARHEGSQQPQRQADDLERAAVLLRQGPRARRRSLCRRRGRHPEPRHLADRRHADRGRGPEFRRRAELCAGNPAARAAAGRHEGEEAAARRCSRWRKRASCRCSGRRTARRRWSAWSARLQLDVLQARLKDEYGLEVMWDAAEFTLARWIAADDPKTLDTFVAANAAAIADDLDGDVVFLARNQFYLDYAREHAPGVRFTDIKDIYNRPAAA